MRLPALAAARPTIDGRYAGPCPCSAEWKTFASGASSDRATRWCSRSTSNGSAAGADGDEASPRSTATNAAGRDCCSSSPDGSLDNSLAPAPAASHIRAMRGYRPVTSFGEEVAEYYDELSVRGDEDATVAFLEQSGGGRSGAGAHEARRRDACRIAAAERRQATGSISPIVVDHASARSQDVTSRLAARNAKGFGAFPAPSYRLITWCSTRSSSLPVDPRLRRAGRAASAPPAVSLRRRGRRARAGHVG